MFFVGVSLGLLIGTGMLAGAAMTAHLNPYGSLPLYGSTTHGGDSMAIATGMIDEGIEGVFMLDYITGELTCQVLHPRTGTLAGLYKRNISADLGVEQGKQPKYLMVTGEINFRQNISNVRPAGSILYIADSNSGRYAAYVLPWNRAAFNQAVVQASQIVPMASGSARNVALEK
jgi:hypothetical protein